MYVAARHVEKFVSVLGQRATVRDLIDVSSIESGMDSSCVRISPLSGWSGAGAKVVVERERAELERGKKERGAELACVEKVREDAETRIRRRVVAESERVKRERENAETLRLHRAKVTVERERAEVACLVNEQEGEVERLKKEQEAEVERLKKEQEAKLERLTKEQAQCVEVDRVKKEREHAQMRYDRRTGCLLKKHQTRGSKNPRSNIADFELKAYLGFRLFEGFLGFRV